MTQSNAFFKRDNMPSKWRLRLWYVIKRLLMDSVAKWKTFCVTRQLFYYQYHEVTYFWNVTGLNINFINYVLWIWVTEWFGASNFPYTSSNRIILKICVWQQDIDYQISIYSNRYNVLKTVSDWIETLGFIIYIYVCVCVCYIINRIHQVKKNDLHIHRINTTHAERAIIHLVHWYIV